MAYNKIVFKKTLPEEKAFVQQGLKAKLIDRQLWQPISNLWFAKWKQYADFDNDGADHRSQEVCVSIASFSSDSVL